MAVLFSHTELPAGFRYPQRLIDIVQHHEPLGSGRWWLIGEMPDYASMCLQHVRQQFPDQQLIPFAKNDDEEVLACFDGQDRSDNPRVYFDTFRYTTTVPWEKRYYVSFMEWLALAQST